MTKIGFRPQSLAVWATAGATVALFGSLALAQSTLPLPAPGSAPTPPTAPAGVPPDVAAKARAAALAAKANVDVTEAWTKASGTATSAPIYLHIVSAKDPDRLLSVDAAMANHVELHDDSPQATARVMPAPVIDIPGGATVNLGAGGRYLTLVGLTALLVGGVGRLRLGIAEECRFTLWKSGGRSWYRDNNLAASVYVPIGIDVAAIDRHAVANEHNFSG